MLSSFLACLSLRVPQAFLGGRESCACFRSRIPFFRLLSYFLWSNDFNNQQHFLSTGLWLIVCHWWAGIFVNKFCHFGKTNVLCRGVTRLDGAWGKKPACPMFEPEVFRKQMHCFEKCLWHCCDFLAPHSDSAPAKLCPFYPLVTFLVLCNKNRTIFRK